MATSVTPTIFHFNTLKTGPVKDILELLDGLPVDQALLLLDFSRRAVQAQKEFDDLGISLAAAGVPLPPESPSS